MDISILKPVAAELKAALTGKRLVAVEEAGPGDFLLRFKGDGGKVVVMMNPRPGMPRLHISSAKRAKARESSPFCHGLENRIRGCIVTDVRQPGLERMVEFMFAGCGGTGEGLILVFELAGRKPNLILTDSSGFVVMAQSCVPISDEAQRPILPGLRYEPPTAAPDAADPALVSVEALAGMFAVAPDIPVEKVLTTRLAGMSPMLAREVSFVAGGRDPEKAHDALGRVMRALDGPAAPRIYRNMRGPVLAGFALRQLYESPFDSYDTASEATEAFFTGLAVAQRLKEAKSALLRDVRSRLGSAKKKLAAIEADVARAEDADRYTLYGQLLMASPGAADRGADSVRLPDVVSGEGELDIPLDPRLTQIKNAENWFIKARKARAGAAILRDRLDVAEVDVERLEVNLAEAEAAETLDEVQRLKGGDVPGLKKAGRVGAAAAGPVFPSFRSSDGYEVVYAKNSKMNDLLTFKLAMPMDLWLHAQGYHGAHVVVRNPDRRPDIPLNTILEAASAAAYHSDGKKEKSVPVDYAFKKYVRKPRDPVPGQAVFTSSKTVFVEPKPPVSLSSKRRP